MPIAIGFASEWQLAIRKYPLQFTHYTIQALLRITHKLKFELLEREACIAGTWDAVNWNNCTYRVCSK